MPPQLIRRGQKGRRAGESHPNARFTDSECDLMRAMHRDLGYGYRRLARIFECDRSHVRKVIKYTRRG